MQHQDNARRPRDQWISSIARAAVLPIVVLLALAGTTSCSSTPKPQPARLMSLMVGVNGVGNFMSKPNTPYSLSGLTFCITKPGKVTIDSVAPYEPSGGLVAQAFAIVPNPFETGENRFHEVEGSLHQFSNPASTNYIPHLNDPKVVTPICPPKPGGSSPRGVTSDLLYVQFMKTTDVTAQDQGLIVRYTSGSQHFTVEFDWPVWLCVQHDPTCPAGD